MRTPEQKNFEFLTGGVALVVFLIAAWAVLKWIWGLLQEIFPSISDWDFFSINISPYLLCLFLVIYLLAEIRGVLNRILESLNKK